MKQAASDHDVMVQPLVAFAGAGQDSEPRPNCLAVPLMHVGTG
jgi:hypothetical protein